MTICKPINLNENIIASEPFDSSSKLTIDERASNSYYWYTGDLPENQPEDTTDPEYKESNEDEFVVSSSEISRLADDMENDDYDDDVDVEDAYFGGHYNV